MFGVLLLIIAILLCASNCDDPSVDNKNPDVTSSLSYAYFSLSSYHYSSYQELSSSYMYLSTLYADLNDTHHRYKRNKYCADYYRSLIPYTEETYIKVTKFSPSFVKKNSHFARIMQGYYGSYNRRAEVDMILERFNLQFQDRKTCSFEPFTTKFDVSMINSEVMDKQILKNKVDTGYSPNKCEKFIVFFDALLNVPSIELNDDGLTGWQNFVKLWMDTNDAPHPFLVQQLLHVFFLSNQFHHDEPGTTLTTPVSLEKYGSWHGFYKCLSVLVEIGKSPSVQDYKRLGITTTPENQPVTTSFPYDKLRSILEFHLKSTPLQSNQDEKNSLKNEAS